MEKMVCDRCGLEEGTCNHIFDEDYILQNEYNYKKELKISSFIILSVTIFLLIGGIILFEYIKG